MNNNNNNGGNVVVENAFGVIKTFHDGKRAEKYEVRQQLKFVCATVANQLATEIASAIQYAESTKTPVKNWKFDMSGRFKKNWLTAKSQIRNVATDTDCLTVFEAERYTLGKFIKKLSRDFTIEFDKNVVYFTEKVAGVDPSEKLSKVEQGLFATIEDLPLVD
jgi:hypothetical protein